MNNFILFTTDLPTFVGCALLAIVYLCLFNHQMDKLEAARKNRWKKEVVKEKDEYYIENHVVNPYNNALDYVEFILLFELITGILTIGVTYTIMGLRASAGTFMLGFFIYSMFQLWIESMKK